VRMIFLYCGCTRPSIAVDRHGAFLPDPSHLTHAPARVMMAERRSTDGDGAMETNHEPAAARERLRRRIADALLDHAGDAVTCVDRDGIIRFWNPGAERIFGWAAEEAEGRSLDLIIPESLRERHWTAFHETVRTGRSRYGSDDVLAVPGVKRDGSRVSLEFTIAIIRDEHGRTDGIVAVLRDVTRRFEETRELRRQLRAAGVETPKL